MKALARGVWLALGIPLRGLEQVGASLIEWWRRGSYLAGVLCAVAVLAVQPRTWTRDVRTVLARQILFSGVDSLWFTMRISAAVGVIVIVQGELWLGAIGQSEQLGTLLLRVVVRELAPLLVNLIVIVRSGTAISAELANMRLAGEIDVLDSQGIDPMPYLVVPRVLALSVSAFGLSLVFIVVSFVSGYVMCALLGVATGTIETFLDNVINATTWSDVGFFLPKTLLTGLLIGVMCANEGLNIRGAVTEVPQIVGRSAIRSLTVVFVIAAMLSLIVYGTILFIEVF